MKYINLFENHASYEEKLNVGEVDISYCKDVKDIHYNPYNTVEFYVGEVTEPQTVKIYTDLNTSVDIEVSEGNKWYTYVLPKDKGLCMIEGDSVKKVVVKANISYEPRYITPFTYGKIIPSSTVEASFKGSKLNITDIKGIFQDCSGLTSLDLSGWDTSNVTDMTSMFSNCSGLTSLDLSKWDISEGTIITNMFEGCSNSLTIRMKGCSEDTINKVTSVKPSGASISTE